MSPKTSYDLFVSYAHADDRGDDPVKVAVLVDAIKSEYARVTGAELRVFFDTRAILPMSVWEKDILTGLRESKMMVAVVS